MTIQAWVLTMKMIDDPVAGALLGTSVGGGGDFDGDGVEDLVVGAPGEGKAYVIYGSTAPFASIYTHNMSCADGLVLAHAERSFAFGQVGSRIRLHAYAFAYGAMYVHAFVFGMRRVWVSE
eukprot:1908572-Rhodomonas_salina.1